VFQCETFDKKLTVKQKIDAMFGYYKVKIKSAEETQSC